MSGIGEGARLAYDALEAAGMTPAAFDISAAFGQAELDGPGASSHRSRLRRHACRPPQRAVPAACLVGARTGTRPRPPRHRLLGLGISAIPDFWLPSLRYLHEIWVPSELTRVAVAAATDLPVRVVPHPLPPVTPTPNMRARLGLPADALIVLTAFHMGSAFTRKNPLAAIAAFRRAFGDAPDRLLAIKLIDHGASPIARDELDRAIAGAPNIRLINVMLPPAGHVRLDCRRRHRVVAAPLGGFRPGSRGGDAARQAGRGDGWSGNMDFMNERNSAPVSYDLVPVQDPYDGAFVADGQLWAEAQCRPCRRLAAPACRRAGVAARLGEAARADIARLLSPESFARTVAELIEVGNNA